MVLAAGFSCRTQLADLADVRALHLAELLAGGRTPASTPEGTRFDPVLAAAQEKNMETLNLFEEEVFALLEAVEALYRSMDNSLRFAVEAKS